MTKRPARSVKELYDLKRTIAEPEMASVVGSSFDVHEPLEESDRERKMNSKGKFTDQNRVIFVGDMRVESGTCNVCSAPCSSCMHRIAAAMESTVDCGSSDNTFQRKEADSSSSIGVKSRSCDDLQTAASETSNLLSGSSSHDSYSENAESKTTLRNSFTCDISEDANMLAEVSTVEAIEQDKFLQSGNSMMGHGMSCSYSRADLHQSASDGEHHVLGCHRNSDLCIPATRDANMLGLDPKLEPDKRDTPCSSFSTDSTRKFGTKKTEMLSQVEATHESRGCIMEPSQVNSRKLGTFPQESLCRKSSSPHSAGIPSRSDLADLSSRENISSKLISNSPCQSDHISGHNAYFNDMEAIQPSQVQEEFRGCLVVNDESLYPGLLSAGSDHGQKSVINPDNEASKATQITSDMCTGEFKNEDQCFKSAAGFSRSESNLHESGTQHQPILSGQAFESDGVLYDVNVCDICGDAGREELLATCSRCSDGAEHTYCMRIMLDKVPEGDWLCEECQLKEEDEIKMLNKAESFSRTSTVQFLNKKIQNLGSSANPESSAKLDSKSTDPEACGSSKEMQCPKATSKTHMDQSDVAPPSRKKVSETSDGPSRTATPTMGTVFSRENSFKNLHMIEVKRTSKASSPGVQSTNSNHTLSRSLTLDSRANSFKNLNMAEKRTSLASSPGGQSKNSSRTLSRSLTLDSNLSNVQREFGSPRGSLSKQVSFKKNVETKVKKLVQGISQKLAKESTLSNIKKPALAKTINKSASFKIMSSGYPNTESLIKTQSLKSPRAEDPIGFKPMKERNVMERKSSVVIDRPLVSSPPIVKKPIPKLDSKSAPLKRNSNNKFELSDIGSKKGFDRENNSVSKEVKKQSSFKCKSYGICDSEKKKAGEFVNKEAVHENSSANISCNDADGITRISVSSADSSHQANLDDKTKGTSASSRLAISGVNHVLGHGKLMEACHATQSCQTDRLTISASKPSADVSLIYGTSKGNKWKDAAKAAMSRNKKSKTVDQSECLSSNNVDYEGSSRNSLTGSNCQKNLPLEGPPFGKEILRSSDTDYCKTDCAAAAADVEQTKTSTKSIYVPVVGDLNVIPPNLDDLDEKSSTQILPDHPSLDATTFRSLVVPEHEFIWQGAFEILRIGRLLETVDGIQAHLSNFASPKVHEVARQFPCKIQLEEVPRVSLWPLQFQETGPKDDNIALYFFAKDADSYEKSYQKLLEAALKNDFALKGNINEVELLIFPSSMLPERSQRWNMLFFLWGVLRVRKLDSSEPHTNLQEEPSGPKIITEILVEELLSSHDCEFSTFQKHAFDQYPPKETFRGNESPGAWTVKFNSIVDFHSVSTTCPANNICKTEDFPSVERFLHKTTVQTESSELSDNTSHSYPRTYSFNHKIYPAAKGNEIKLGNLDNEGEVGKIPHIHANSAQQKLGGSLTRYSVASGFRQDSEGRGEILEKERSVKIEVESEENIKEIDCLIWNSKPKIKRAHSIEADTWQAKTSFLSVEDDREHKRMKCDSEDHVNISSRDRSMECRLPSKAQLFVTTYLDEKKGGGVNYDNVMPESSRCAERCFFLPDTCPVGSNLMENYRCFLPPVGNEKPESNAPDLELALCSKKSPSRKEIVPLFLPLVDKGRLDKLSGPLVDDDDVLTSLSLSLPSPGMDRRTENPVLKEDHPCLKWL